MPSVVSRSNLEADSFMMAMWIMQCPDGGGGFDPFCNDTAPPGAWLSNLMGRRIPIPAGAAASMVLTTWQPDPSIPVEENAYRVFTRIRGRAQMPFASTSNVSIVHRKYRGYALVKEYILSCLPLPTVNFCE